MIEDKTFINKLCKYKVIGFYKKIDGKDIVVYVYKEGKNKGKVATTLKLSEQQVKNFKLR